MSKGNILDDINNPANTNQAISKDEEGDKSNSRAIRQAEELIVQLPESHPGRSEWLRRYGEKEEAAALRRQSER